MSAPPMLSVARRPVAGKGGLRVEPFRPAVRTTRCGRSRCRPRRDGWGQKMATTRGGARRGRTVTGAGGCGGRGARCAGRGVGGRGDDHPGQARQGDAVELTFVVPEERAGARTEQIEVRLPAGRPDRRGLPDVGGRLGAPDHLPQPGQAGRRHPLLRGQHGDHRGDLGPGGRAGGAGPARLALSMGPMPQTDRLTFEVVQTYADGTVVRWADPVGGGHRAPTLALVPAAPGAATGHHGGAADGPDAQARPGRRCGTDRRRRGRRTQRGRDARRPACWPGWAAARRSAGWSAAGADGLPPTRRPTGTTTRRRTTPPRPTGAGVSTGRPRATRRHRPRAGGGTLSADRRRPGQPHRQIRSHVHCRQPTTCGLTRPA